MMNVEGELFRVENISKTYQNGEQITRALDNISFEVARGEMVAIMGSSGSGKSTLLNILGALDEPNLGKIYLNGDYQENYFKEPFATENRKNNIGFVFQNFSLLNDLTVRENVELPLMLKEEKKNNIKYKVEETVKLVGLENKLDNSISNLSGGQQQRVAIARAIIAQPQILLADEPTGNLDYNTSMEIMELFTSLQKQIQQTMIIVTHDPIVATYADRVLFFHDGKKKMEYKNEEDKDNFSEILNVFRQISKKE